MRELFGTAAAAADTPTQAYSFACMSCGHGWEQGYRIERLTDRDGRSRAVYWADDVRVPSPLTSPSCPGCGGGRVRVMGAGRVARVDSWCHAGARGAAPAAGGPDSGPAVRPAHHFWQLHFPFHLRLHRGR